MSTTPLVAPHTVLAWPDRSEQEAVRVFCNDQSNQSAGVGTEDWISGSADATAIVLPGGYFPSPALKKGIVRWHIVGEYTGTANGPMTSVDVQLRLDDSAVGTAISFGTVADNASGPSLLTAEIDLYPVWKANATNSKPDFWLDGRMAIVDTTGAIRSGFSPVQRKLVKLSGVIDVTADHRLNIQIKKSTALATHILDIRSVLGLHYGAFWS